MLRICHINLAKGFRGGERQTELLIRELSRHQDIRQMLLSRRDSPLVPRLAGCPGLSVHGAAKPYVKHIPSLRGCDLMHVHEARAGQVAYFASRLFGIPFVITRRVPNPLKDNPLTRAVYSRASHVVALSRAIRDILLAYQPSLRVSVIPSMVSGLTGHPACWAQLKEAYEGFFIVGHAGALVNRHKGQQYLIEAARLLEDRYPKMRFLFLGSGLDEGWLKGLAEDLDNVEFLGFQESIGDYLGLFDVFAFPSLQEGLGSVLLDAMAFGLPIVASRVDGIPDIIEDGQNGLLVAPKDAAALARSLERFYTDQALRERLSRQARHDSQAYLPPEIAARYVQLYSAVREQAASG